MRNDRATEHELLNELDSMYRRVADLERGGTVEGTVPRQDSSTHEKVIPFPLHRIRKPSSEAFEEEQEPSEKAPAASRRMVVRLSVGLFVLIFWVIIVKTTIDPGDLELGRATSSPYVPREESRFQLDRERPEEAIPGPHQATGADGGLPREGYFAIQVGAFRNMENAQELVEALGKRGLDAYSVDRSRRGPWALHKVFLGPFGDRDEAAALMNDTVILEDYPDSFVLKILPRDNHR
jgi:hypothetical protein